MSLKLYSNMAHYIELLEKNLLSHIKLPHRCISHTSRFGECFFFIVNFHGDTFLTIHIAGQWSHSMKPIFISEKILQFGFLHWVKNYVNQYCLANGVNRGNMLRQSSKLIPKLFILYFVIWFGEYQTVPLNNKLLAKKRKSYPLLCCP